MDGPVSFAPWTEKERPAPYAILAINSTLHIQHQPPPNPSLSTDLYPHLTPGVMGERPKGVVEAGT